jgi:hypothetical protein
MGAYGGPGATGMDSVFVNLENNTDENTNLPSEFALFQNYPNPFNLKTTIEFSLPRSSLVSLNIYNILGEEVAILVSEDLSAGKYKYNWDVSEMVSGVYLYRMTAGEFNQTKKIILLK